ncbi:MAG: hypothetical protein A2600_00860 [Candidatus Lambdaproteobacteria bacterium RIFOXYD1_FULL_56_27]|uniref:Bacterial surface antigen (D15) domain-containing protein n=1 Tax=Candidatus Lambdaproteobacteria bacterium RIFOXYD2_FULL_56_26 TaxID=1817773 RepID=A0A1F6GLM5_9PROT|nr:MAG: hypothetical protein A2557_09660 [Candidatus Lambdaproteobacteria bacterium RIFOXYD2_FULL_56_26]OGH05681.1 MAG: hypothetical protein A2426_04070 [Candidatus Lambdaproteobacteria bacterium RIFOXYC1_FULL_56_13]OGH07103.1 MAG: hypothetical protein A2600_00860 [Candidatus Lambdaproteobacteria bacterium RIFOXYD1_FULL_56_27]
MKRTLLIGLFCFALASSGFAWVPERRTDGGTKEFGWFFAPTPIKLEGIGQGVPVFGLLSNFYETTDLIFVKTLPGGDFDLNVYLLDQLPAFTDHILLTAGSFDQLATYSLYGRGVDSSKDDFIRPLARSKGNFYQVKLLGWEERLQGFYQVFRGTQEVRKTYDAKGNLLSEQTSKNDFDGKTYGAILDLTDEVVDPRIGVRMGRKYIPSKSNIALKSDITVVDTDFNVYIPFFHKDTLVMSGFLSTSQIDRSGVTDEATARVIYNQNCDPTSPFYSACKASEDKLVNEFLSYNRYGNATPLGGSNRLRSYPQGRFSAGSTSYQGIEYRFNLADDPKEVNWFFLGGIQTLFQVAFFAEQGTVSETRSGLGSNLKSSYGAGLRALISGFVYRLDVATGNEGVGVTLFIDYPMQLNPIN